MTLSNDIKCAYTAIDGIRDWIMDCNKTLSKLGEYLAGSFNKVELRLLALEALPATGHPKEGNSKMHISDNIAWLEDLAMHSGEAGNSNQQQRLLTISAWIEEAAWKLEMRTDLVESQRLRLQELFRENENLSNQLARSC